jgi:uncharacterized Zn finger protein (UPF0148 family)
MYCLKCGTQIPEGSAICPSCGVKDEIAEIRIKMKKFPTPPELAHLKTELRLALESIQGNNSLSQQDRERIVKLARAVEKLNKQSGTKEAIEEMRDKLINILEIIFPDKKYER